MLPPSNVFQGGKSFTPITLPSVTVLKWSRWIPQITHLRLPKAAHQHQAHDGQEQHKVKAAVKANVTGIWCRIHSLHDLALVKPAVDQPKNEQQAANQKQRFRQQRVDCPEEINTLQKSQKQRRVTQGCERATRI